MKYAAIVPVPILEITRDYDCHMILGPLCEKEEGYGLFYHEVGGWKILDNGAAEGKAMTPEALVGWANILQADEIIAPDILHDTHGSVALLTDFMKFAETDRNVMAVIQATTWVEFEYSLHAALDLDVYSVALPKLLTKHLGPSARLAAAVQIREQTDKPIHCLGCSTHLREARDLAVQGIVRSIDSAAPVVLGLKGLSITNAKYDWEASHSSIPDYWRQGITEEVLQNLDRFQRWCKTTTSTSEV